MRKKAHRCACGKFTTADQCGECVRDEADAGPTEAELDAMIAAQLPTMPAEPSDRGAYKALRQERAQKTGSDVHLDPPAHRLIRMGRRWNGRSMA